jgi:hypothetical protein
MATHPHTTTVLQYLFGLVSNLQWSFIHPFVSFSFCLLDTYPILWYKRTATAEGQIMAQVLSTFSRMEQSRFEAFRRATFPRDAIAKYVAHCLIEEQHRPIAQGIPTTSATTTIRTSKPLREPILSEVVAVGQAEDISIVVATLAKAYAQRLVTAARRHASIRNSKEAAAAASEASSGHGSTVATAGADTETTTNNSNRSGGSNSHRQSTQFTSSAMTPDDIMKAYNQRKAQGLDPGFFLQRWERSQNVLTDNDDVYQHKRLAALHAQEQYDKLHGGPPASSDDENDYEKEGDDNVGAGMDGQESYEGTREHQQEIADKDNAEPMDTSQS